MEEKKQDTKATEKVEKKEEKKVADKKATTEVKKEEAKKEAKKQETPKFDKAKGEKKKSNTGVIVGVVVVALVIVALIAGMLLMKDSPKKVVETMLNDLKTGNYDQSLLTSVMEEGNLNQETQALFFEKLEGKVLNVTEEGDRATVEVEITNKDFKTIINNYMQKIVKIAFSGNNPSEEEISNYLVEELKNDEIQTVTSNQSIILERKDGKWDVSEENDFANILLPGFNEAINAFSD